MNVVITYNYCSYYVWKFCNPELLNKAIMSENFPQGLYTVTLSGRLEPVLNLLLGTLTVSLKYYLELIN